MPHGHLLSAMASCDGKLSASRKEHGESAFSLLANFKDATMAASFIHIEGLFIYYWTTPSWLLVDAFQRIATPSLQHTRPNWTTENTRSMIYLGSL